jgi:hypothetical protein
MTYEEQIGEILGRFPFASVANDLRPWVPGSPVRPLDQEIADMKTVARNLLAEVGKKGPGAFAHHHGLFAINNLGCLVLGYADHVWSAAEGVRLTTEQAMAAEFLAKGDAADLAALVDRLADNGVVDREVGARLRAYRQALWAMCEWMEKHQRYSATCNRLRQQALEVLGDTSDPKESP